MDRFGDKCFQVYTVMHKSLPEIALRFPRLLDELSGVKKEHIMFD